MLNTKEGILKNVGNQIATDFYIWEKKILWKSMGVCVCVQPKREIHTDLQQHEGK